MAYLMPRPAGPTRSSLCDVPFLAVVVLLSTFCLGLGLALGPVFRPAAATFMTSVVPMHTHAQTRPALVLSPGARLPSGVVVPQQQAIALPRQPHAHRTPEGFFMPGHGPSSPAGGAPWHPVIASGGQLLALLVTAVVLAAYRVYLTECVPRYWAMTATSGEKSPEQAGKVEGGESVVTSTLSPMPDLTFKWSRIALFAFSPLALTPLAAIATLVFGVNCLGPNYTADLPALVDGVKWAVPLLVFSLLPLEKIPGLAALEEITQVTKFIGLTAFGVEKSIQSVARVVLATLCLSLAAGVGEELVFRGALQGGLGQLLLWAGTPAAVVTAVPLLVSSVIFGVLHSYSNSPVYAIVATIAGGWFGWCYLSTGNILIPMVAHTLVDWVSFFSVHVLVAYLSSEDDRLALWNLDAPIAKQFRAALFGAQAPASKAPPGEP
mmetsp:Transcript_28859/g.51821  ORF Transcript_28859/g.51821 Transcript_28859/m.51821 type:complete len:436 (-) Transcript_28859:82-1389(-)